MKTPDFRCPASQKLWETHLMNGVPVEHVTSNRDRTKYTLWRIVGEKWTAVKTAVSPMMLRED